LDEKDTQEIYSSPAAELTDKDLEELTALGK
jgi:hypothetical protein